MPKASSRCPPSPQVLLCASSQTSSIVECWSLRKEGLPVNNIFQQISPVGEPLVGSGHLTFNFGKRGLREAKSLPVVTQQAA